MIISQLATCEECRDGSCKTCEAFKKRRAAQDKRNRARRAKNQAMRDLGLVSVRGNLGGRYWE
jgi:hypothetical protein